MSDVAIVTDSTAYLPAELVERHDVHVVPLYVVFDGDRPVPEVESQAKEALERDGKGGERITVVDSQTTAGGLGFMVLAAAKAAREGASAEDTAAHVAEARAEFKLWFAIDTLEFLKRGGRVRAAGAPVGSAPEGETHPPPAGG